VVVPQNDTFHLRSARPQRCAAVEPARVADGNVVNAATPVRYYPSAAGNTYS
jgi:hypothetical protein